MKHRIETVYSTSKDSNDIRWHKGWRPCIFFASSPPSSLSNVTLCMLLVNVEISTNGTSFALGTDELRTAGWVGRNRLIRYSHHHDHHMDKFQQCFRPKARDHGHLAHSTSLSGGCRASQTISQLIIDRTFQRMGAAGCVSMAPMIAYEIIPKERMLQSLQTLWQQLRPMIWMFHSSKVVSVRDLPRDWCFYSTHQLT